MGSNPMLDNDAAFWIITKYKTAYNIELSEHP